MKFGPDVFLPTIRITENNNQFRITEDGSACVYSLKPGVYFAHNDATLDATHPGLYRAIAHILINNLGSPFYDSHTGSPPTDVAYDFEAVDPLISPFIPYSGLRLGGAWVGGGSPPAIVFSIDFDHVDFTMDPRWFGFDGGLAIASPSAGAYWVNSPGSVFGRWYSHSLYNGEASRKHPIPFASVEYSSKRPSDSVAIPWEIGVYRQFVYPFVHSAHVFDRRAKNAEHAAAAGLAFEDTNNSFEENVWAALVQSEQVIIVHDTGRDSLIPTDHEFEVVKLAGPWPEFKPQLAPYRGEFYTLDFRVWVNPEIGGYSF